MLKVRKEIVDKLYVEPGVDVVIKCLQDAVKTELMTIPPYLTALFSIEENNGKAGALVHSVVFEEMFHMTLAANTLIAIGGDVPIFKLGTSIRYPSTFPLDLDGGLVVGLASLTKKQTHDIFMAIERPDTMAALPGEPEPLPPIGHSSHAVSLGDFYEAVIHALKELGAGIFANPRKERQIDISKWFPYKIYTCPDGPADALLGPAESFNGKVDSFDTAKAVLMKIIEQGEGLQIKQDRINPKDGDGGNYAHYFKFGEIYYGRTLERDPNDRSGWSYSGEPVSLDSENICTVKENAALSDYQVGSGAYIAGSEFYETYCGLLRALDETFNGRPEKLNSAMGLMFQLKLVAQQVMRFPVGDGVFAAPPFMP
ncbi:ferritin-like domain-containing protein [Burkholderia ubonensis]|uniref:Iminophenyl-pyruvate dimer synthase domain-containing protein n=1 Tax=Burkholderia ubonensis subsp. mesacidophila TaxID=265293 RepID=A0A2A4FA63_9BURK|nr:ferritin-like protein [Burkholderia ubonensis]PCE29550.1 hypothetical protein BZL54_25535 [Burkholderia ubonensis subsp. mesacidophila]